MRKPCGVYGDLPHTRPAAIRAAATDVPGCSSPGFPLKERTAIHLFWQSGVLGFGLLQNGDIGIRIFPQSEEVLVGLAAARGVAGQGCGMSEPQMRERDVER